MQTRREALILTGAIPLFAADAVAQEVDDLEHLLNFVSEKLNTDYIRVQYANLSFFLTLVFRANVGDVKSAIVTYQLLGQKIGHGFDTERIQAIRPSLKKEYLLHRQELYTFLTSVGIQSPSPPPPDRSPPPPDRSARFLVEESLVSMMWFYALATGAKNVTEMKWCFWPFCFERPD
jgi:hypothetical protein